MTRPSGISAPSTAFQLWLVACTCCIASSFFIAGSLSLTKIGFALLLIGFPLAKGAGLFTYPKPSTSDVTLAAFAALSALTILYAVDRNEAFGHYSSLVNSLVLYVLARSLLENRQDRAAVFFLALVMAALLSSAIGAVQFTTGRLFVPGTEDRSMRTGDSFRANGLFDDPNYFGYLLTMAWPIAALLYRDRPFTRNVVCGTLLAAVIMTYSRATLLIVALQILALALAFSRHPLQLLWRLAIVAIALGPGLLFLNPFGILDRLITLAPLFLGTDSPIDNSTAERVDLLSAGLLMFMEHFWLGVGFGNFQVLSADYMQFFPRSVYAHNTYLTVAAESGVIGILIYLSFLLAIAVRLLSRGHYFLLVSLLGLAASNFFLVAHYFPITYLYFAALASYSGMGDRRA
jgi:putative inorganic carbon (HCO3(-)) transporter